MNKQDRLLLGFKNVLVSCTIFAFIFGSFSCGRQQEAEFKPKIRTNSAPVINSVIISPKNPNVNSNLELFVQSQDSDGDPVTYYYQWVKNDQNILDENKNILRSGNFKKGDLIRVSVIPSDGKIDGKPFLSDIVKILNSLPIVQEVWIEPKAACANDSLRVQLKGVDADEDAIRYSYRWEKNGEVLSEEIGDVLGKGKFKRGDRIAVEVTPNDGEIQGVPQKSKINTILNSPPTIVSSPPTSMQGNDYSYQIKAYDPDNDLVFFTLKSAPKGMEINKETGLIKWVVRWENRGTHSIEIEASDKEGAKCIQRYVLNVEIR